MMNSLKGAVITALLLAFAAPAFSAPASFFMRCEQDDDFTEKDLAAFFTKWKKAALTIDGVSRIEVALHFPIVAQMGEYDFAINIITPSLMEWAAFVEGYEGSAAQAMNGEWDEMAACPDSALYRSIRTE